MIKVESGIYEAQANAEGGWSGWRPFVVAKRLDETPDVVSFYLKPADGGKVPAWKPGQFVSVRAYLPELKPKWSERAARFDCRDGSLNSRGEGRLPIREKCGKAFSVAALRV